MKRFFIIPALALSVLCAAVAQESTDLPTVEPERYTFKERQTQLVELARTLGGMHHYHKICRPYHYEPELFRNRVKELITFEDPQQTTKEEMIAAFNLGVKGGAQKYEFCEYGAEDEMRRLSTDGLIISDRLATPFRQMQGYDYDPLAEVSIENGVRVYRGNIQD
jgi:uncharacterized protein (TIGR02301 family)